jgi:hypothetical protein
MSLSMYEASVPVFKQLLVALDECLGKAEAHATEKKFEPNALLQARLFPDMFALVRQVQIACDFAKGTCARLAGIEPPKFEDNESSLAELQSRIAKTRQFMSTIKAAQIDGSEGRDVKFKAGPREFEFKGLAYLTGFALPNFYFHHAMTYAILRHNGLELSKKDYIG